MQSSQIPRGKRIPTQYLFLINGIASLLGYNALLTSLDYFNSVYDGYDVYAWFLPPAFLAYVVTALTYKFISDKYNYKTIITVGIFTCSIALVLLLLLTFISKDSKGFGFYVSLLCCFLLGAGSNLYQLTFFGMINYLSQSVVSKFTIGTAVGGLMITSLRMFIVAVAGTDQSLQAPIIIYFMIAILFNFFTLNQNLVFLKSRQYKIKIMPYLNKKTQQQESSLSENLKDTNTLAESINQNEENSSYFKLLFETSKSIFPYPILILCTYIVTFLVFPNLTINKKYDNLEFVWSSLLFLFTYNLGDTVGKFVCDYRWTFNSLSIIYLFSARSYFLVSIPLLVTTFFNDDPLIDNYFYPYLIQFLFSLSNGIMTNGCFIQSFQICPQKYKKYAGVLNGIMLQIGILIGTNLAIPFSSLFINSN